MVKKKRKKRKKKELTDEELNIILEPIDELRPPSTQPDKIKKFRNDLHNALKAEGVKRKKSPMRRAAEAFYEDKTVMVAIMKHLLPTLKAVEAKIDEIPFKFIVETKGDEKPKEDKE